MNTFWPVPASLLLPSSSAPAPREVIFYSHIYERERESWNRNPGGINIWWGLCQHELLWETKTWPKMLQTSFWLLLVKLLNTYYLKVWVTFWNRVGLVYLQLWLIRNLCLKSLTNQIMQGIKITAFTKEISRMLSAVHINVKYSEKILMGRNEGRKAERKFRK